MNTLQTTTSDERFLFFTQVKKRIHAQFGKKTQIRMNICTWTLSVSLALFFSLLFVKKVLNLYPNEITIALALIISVMAIFFTMMVFWSCQSSLIKNSCLKESQDGLNNHNLLHFTYLNKEEIQQLFCLTLTKEENIQFKEIVMEDKYISLYKLYTVFQPIINYHHQFIFAQSTKNQKELNLQQFLKENNLVENTSQIVNMGENKKVTHLRRL